MAAVLALLVVGGMALVNAVSGDADPKGPSATVSSDGGGGSPSPSADSPSQAPALLIRVVGAPTKVVVRVPDGEIFFTGVMNTGETYHYNETPLSVVADNGSSLEVTIHGEEQDPASAQRTVWSVPQRS
ncbi:MULTISPECIES: RodZ domain-containing protein [Actinomadura]|uniref:RodZ domain-containing protein n=1 Tax=Actinomadura TaxID=1988 RepID=UPI0007E8B889|nr:MULTISPECIES: RodZ domain-containing protein [Actinomadura]